MKKITRIFPGLFLCLIMAVSLAACGGSVGGSGDGSAGDGTGGNGDGIGGGTGNPSTLTAQSTLPAGDANCPYGGVKLDYGIDENGNGVLDVPSEVDGSEYICNGSPGLPALINTSAADIVNCPDGGIKIEAGIDADEDNVLDADEVNPDSTTYICNPGGGTFYTIGGTVSGLSGTLVLQKNGYDDLTISLDGPFKFSTPVTDGAGYTVSVKTHPDGQLCSVSNASGTVSGSVGNVAVNCLNFGPRYGAAPDWNDYARASDTSQACDGTETGGYAACIHGGEARALEVTGKSECTGLTATDALGAFDWTCIVDAGKAKMVSTGLKEGMNLSDLIDFDAEEWKTNSVTVMEWAGTLLETGTSVWWDNPVEVNRYGCNLGSAGTIYLIDMSTSSVCTFSANKTALVIRPGVTLQGTSATNETIVSADNRNFLWVEGSVDATDDSYGLYLTNVMFSVLRNIDVENAGNAVRLDYSENNNLSDVSTNRRLHLYYSPYNTLSDITATNSSSYGIHVNNSENTTLTDVISANSANIGIFVEYSDNVTLTNVISANNGSYGIRLTSADKIIMANVRSTNNSSYGIYGDSLDGILADVTATNNVSYGINAQLQNGILMDATAANSSVAGVLISGPYTTVSDVASVNNTYGIYVSSSYNTFSDIMVANNVNDGIKLSGISNNNHFTGVLKSGNNGGEDCYVYATSTAPGLVNGTCSTDGTYGSGGTDGYGITNTSDAVFYNGVTFDTAFVGKVTTDDTANQSDTIDGGATYGTNDYALITDWVNFDNPYRGWGMEGTFGDPGIQGGCTTGTCRIWDWSLLAGDLGDPGPNGTFGDSDDTTAVLDINTVPTGDSADTMTHTWSPINGTDCGTIDGAVWGTACTTTFLRDSVEVMGDGAGNDNALCETDETCIFTPNIGSYQGHGDLVDVGTITGDTIQNVTLKEYSTNGH